MNVDQIDHVKIIYNIIIVSGVMEEVRSLSIFNNAKTCYYNIIILLLKKITKYQNINCREWMKELHKHCNDETF